MFGGGVAAAFSHCMLAGSRAINGVKLHKDVVDVFNASQGGCKLEGSPVKLAVKAEPVKAEPQMKNELHIKRDEKALVLSFSNACNAYPGGLEASGCTSS